LLERKVHDEYFFWALRALFPFAAEIIAQPNFNSAFRSHTHLRLAIELICINDRNSTTLMGVSDMVQLVLIVSILGGGNGTAPGVAISKISSFTNEAACNRASNGAQANGVKSFVAPTTNGQGPNVQFHFFAFRSRVMNQNDAALGTGATT
jgi:hypothetical protein